MPDSRREEFLKRLSTVGIGTRGSIEVMLESIVQDIRDQVAHKRIADEEMDDAIAFHDRTEALMRDMLSTNPPLDAARMIERLRGLRDTSHGVAEQFHRKLERAVAQAEEFQREHRE